MLLNACVENMEPFLTILSNLQTGKLLKENQKEEGHTKTITSLVKSPDGSHFLTGSLDKSAKVLFLIIFFFSFYRV